MTIKAIPTPMVMTICQAMKRRKAQSKVHHPFQGDFSKLGRGGGVAVGIGGGAS